MQRETPKNLSSFCTSKAISLPKSNPLPQFNPNHPIPYSFSHYYATCSNSWRSRLSLSNAAALLKGQNKGLVNHATYKKCRSGLQRNLTVGRVLWGLFISNIAVCIVRRSADPEFMRRNFTVSFENLRNLHLHTIMISGFNLADTGKPVLYMIGLLVFGGNIGRIFGGEFLLSLYLAGAFIGSVFFMVGKKNLEKSAKKTQARGIDHLNILGSGCNGAVNAVVLLDLFLFPKRRLYCYRVPAILLGAMIIGGDWWRIIKGIYTEFSGAAPPFLLSQGIDTKFSGAAHLGGSLVATSSYLRIVGVAHLRRGLLRATSWLVISCLL